MEKRMEYLIDLGITTRPRNRGRNRDRKVVGKLTEPNKKRAQGRANGQPTPIKNKNGRRGEEETLVLCGEKGECLRPSGSFTATRRVAGE